MEKLFIMLVCCSLGLSGLGQELGASSQDLASLDVPNQVEFELSHKDGVVLIEYGSALPADIELQFLTKSGGVLWSKMLFGFQGTGKEKLNYLVPEGNYITRVYYGQNEITKRIVFRSSEGEFQR